MNFIIIALFKFLRESLVIMSSIFDVHHHQIKAKILTSPRPILRCRNFCSYLTIGDILVHSPLINFPKQLDKKLDEITYCRVSNSFSCHCGSLSVSITTNSNLISNCVLLNKTETFARVRGVKTWSDEYFYEAFSFLYCVSCWLPCCNEATCSRNCAFFAHCYSVIFFSVAIWKDGILIGDTKSETF